MKQHNKRLCRGKVFLAPFNRHLAINPEKLLAELKDDFFATYSFPFLLTSQT